MNPLAGGRSSPGALLAEAPAGLAPSGPPRLPRNGGLRGARGRVIRNPDELLTNLRISFWLPRNDYELLGILMNS